MHNLRNFLINTGKPAFIWYKENIEAEGVICHVQHREEYKEHIKHLKPQMRMSLIRNNVKRQIQQPYGVYEPVAELYAPGSSGKPGKYPGALLPRTVRYKWKRRLESWSTAVYEKNLVPILDILVKTKPDDAVYLFMDKAFPKASLLCLYDCRANKFLRESLWSGEEEYLSSLPESE